MSDVIKDLYKVILNRRASAEENSYTAYLFCEGLDKILKKIGEESSETIIAAKSLEAALAGAGADVGAGTGAGTEGDDCSHTNPDSESKPTNPVTEPASSDIIPARRTDLKNEVSDLLYHLLVMLAERGIAWEEIEKILADRASKAGNLKQIKETNKNS